MSSDRSSYNGIGLQNVTQPKSQPIRLKALLQACESDDDDDESEVKSLESEDESDFNEPQPLLQDKSAENVLLQEMSPCKVGVNSSSTSEAEDIKDKFLSVIHVSPEENSKIATDISSMQQKTNSTKENKEDREVGHVKSERINFTLGETNKLEIHDRKCEEKMQECHDGLTTAGRNYQSDAECPKDIALPSSSLPIYKGDYNTEFDRNRNLSSISSAQSHHECAYIPDILNKKEEHMYNVSSESKRLLAKNSESYLLNLSKEDRRHRGVQNSVEWMNMDRKFSNGLKSAGCVNPQTTSGNLSHTTVKYNSQYNEHARYEANKKYVTTDNTCTEFNTPSISGAIKSLSSMTRSVAETPLKHMQAMGTMHPNPCTSHKQLFRTPQSKLPGDSNKSHVQTPSTILSSWSQNNMRQTPMDGKNFIAKDCMQTPRNIVFTPTIGKGDPSRYIEMDAKNARRPLTDAVLMYSEPLAYPLESKPLLLQTRTETKCVTAESQQEDRSRKIIGLSEVKSMQTEGNYDNNLKSVNLHQETKEDKQPNMSNVLLGSHTKDIHDKKENKLAMIGATTGTKIIQDFERKYKSEDNIVPNAEPKCKKSYDPYTVPEKQAIPQREELRHIVDRVGNIQFSIPLTIPSQRQGKALFVKDREYLILGSLGRGMSAEVLRVQDGSCGELRAIKCVDLSKMDKESAQGCLDEISLLRKLQAPCVVKMFDYHIKESLVYVVMEMGDTDLSRLLKSMSQEKRIPVTMILYYWTEMLTAVKHIHDNGVIHSDLKPGNFLLVRGRLKLIDFGIASNINSDMTSVLKNNPIGTLNYISPEALMDIGGSADSPTHNVKYKISFKSDVWSLGCILYSLVYGHTPFHHIRSQWAKVNAITNPKPNISFPTTVLSGGHERTPPILIDVMRKCLQHDPKARPTVSQLLQVQYMPNKQDAAPILMPNIPANILVKIKRALNEEEWRQLLQILDKSA